MARQRSTLEVIPSPRRLIRSLRDVGYDFKHAVADLVDNSVAAGATCVAIDMRFDGRESWLRIADNGCGMSGAAITEAMRFGTERSYSEDELGKFGLGLKTASLSQCSKLTVASRVDVNTRRIEVRQWDLTHVEATNRWEIIDVPAEERPEELIGPLQDRPGTVVLWELMDRVLGYKTPWGDRARNGFYRLAEELDIHLGMVFHRFLTGESRQKRVLKIIINGTTVDPWDPFARNENATVRLPTKQFEISGDEGRGLVLYAPFILPIKEQFSSLKAFERLAGPGKWNYQQGFYIYRADRMIQSGGWSYLRTSDEHTKFARIALDFWPDLDSEFDINIAKARVNLPADLRAKLQPHVEQLVKQARKLYTPPKESTGAGYPSSDPFPALSSISSNEAGNVVGRCGSERSNNPTTGSPCASGCTMIHPAAGAATMALGGGDDCNHGRIGQALEKAAAKAGETPALNRIRKALLADNPDIASEIGWQT
jgi:anti-sigma regulatory factor (Ser/Thr protein kinase)